MYYCYNDDCPVRTKEEPWPRSDWTLKYIKVVSKRGHPYYRKLPVCNHCGKIMSCVSDKFED